MSYPASGVESAYRNNIQSVAQFLNTKHKDQYLVFNLSERTYDPTPFNQKVLLITLLKKIFQMYCILWGKQVVETDCCLGFRLWLS
jgi:hypothetical protein